METGVRPRSTAIKKTCWFHANQYLLLLINAAWLAEKQQILSLQSGTWTGFEPMIYCTRDECANHYTTDAVYTKKSTEIDGNSCKSYAWRLPSSIVDTMWRPEGLIEKLLTLLSTVPISNISLHELMLINLTIPSKKLERYIFFVNNL
jgi:hypothetical protein